MNVHNFAFVKSGFDTSLDVGQMRLSVFERHESVFVNGITLDASSPSADDLLQL